MRNLHLETQGKQISVVYIEFTPLLTDEKLKGIHSHLRGVVVCIVLPP